MTHSKTCAVPDTLTEFLAPGTDAEVASRYAQLPATAAEASWGIEEEIAFLDVETTGIDPHRDRIIEIAVMIARGPEVIERYSSLVDPGRPVPRDTTLLTGIDDEMLAGAPTIVTEQRPVVYVQLTPGQSPPPGATVIDAKAPKPITIVTRVAAPAQRTVVVRTTQSGKVIP